MKKYINNFVGVLFLTIWISTPLSMDAQRRATTPPPISAAPSQKDTAVKSAVKEPAVLEKYIKAGTSVMQGLTPVYHQEGRYYLAIHDTLIGRDILMVARLSKAAAGKRNKLDGYKGDKVNSAMLRFEKAPNHKILIRKVLTQEQSKDSTQSMYNSLLNSNFYPILANLEVKALSADKRSALIDITDLISIDNEALFLSKEYKTTFRLGNMQADKSYIVSVKTYPINTELRTVKTYSVTDSDSPASYEINCSMVLLPKTPMQPRYADSRVGFFTTDYVDFDQNPQGVENVRMITRWRLEPKPEDMEKYRRGELVEPAKPIIFYIDPTTPKEWVPYMIQAVNDWQPAFEKAGFKNAIMGRVAPTPEEDPTWSLEDARFSAIMYKPSSVENAQGPHIHDPRSGEIIESHINWFHNVMKSMRDQYFIQCAAVDPGARKKIFDTELMGRLIRWMLAHEVGHTLGLSHNFGGSFCYTTAELRDPKSLKEKGHTASIMDYARCNFVAQPQDNIPVELLIPRVGCYDQWAIEWGYRRFLNITDPVAEKEKLNKWIIEKNKDPRYWYGSGSADRPGSQSDPRAESEDLGDNQMETCELGIKNLKVIIANLPEWATVENEDYAFLSSVLGEARKQYRDFLSPAIRWIGGSYENLKTAGEAGPIYTYVEKHKQQEAMQFLNRHIFTTPEWLVPEKLNALTGEKGYTAIASLQNFTFAILFRSSKINDLLAAETLLGKNTYTLENLFADLNQYVWKELNSRQSVDMYRCSLQKIYVQRLINLLNSLSALPASGVGASSTRTAGDHPHASSIVYFQLSELQKRLKAATPSDMNTRAHYTCLEGMIEKALKK